MSCLACKQGLSQAVGKLMMLAVAEKHVGAQLTTLADPCAELIRKSR